MNIPFFRIPVPEVLERENRPEHRRLQRGGRASQSAPRRLLASSAIDGKWPEGLMWERFHRYRVAVIASREKAARLR